MAEDLRHQVAPQAKHRIENMRPSAGPVAENPIPTGPRADVSAGLIPTAVASEETASGSLVTTTATGASRAVELLSAAGAGLLGFAVGGPIVGIPLTILSTILSLSGPKSGEEITIS